MPTGPPSRGNEPVHPCLALTDEDLFGEWDDPGYGEGAAERYVPSLKTGMALNRDPGGKKFLYSDAGYDTLADLIHKA